MNTEHPLYSTLKDYYTNIGSTESNSNINNTLLMQYIEDTCVMDKNDNKFKYFNKCYLQCDRTYFVNVDITGEDTKIYCYFTNKFLNKFGSIHFIFSIRNIDNYGFVSFKDEEYIICYLFKYTK